MTNFAIAAAYLLAIAAVLWFAHVTGLLGAS
jgi:hypothetical protein